MADPVKREKYVPPEFSDCSLAISDPTQSSPFIVTWGLALEGTNEWDQTKVDDLYDRIAEAMKGQMTNAYNFASLTVRVGSGDEVPVWISASNVAGTNENQCVPANCATLVTKNTGLGGRKNKGRLFWPFAVEAAVDVRGQHSTPGYGDLSSVFNTFFAIMNGEAQDLEWTDGMYLFHSRVAGSSSTPAATRVTSLTVDPKIATQRRRLRR